MKRIWMAAVIPLAALFTASCTVEQTEEGEAPEIEVEGGKLPEYDVDPARIEVGKDTKTVVVPDVDVKTRSDTTRRN
jgi:hypothetical protein